MPLPKRVVCGHKSAPLRGTLGILALVALTKVLPLLANSRVRLGFATVKAMPWSWHGRKAMLPLCPGTMPGNGKGRVRVGSCERRQFPFLFCLVLLALQHHHDPGPDVD